MDRNKYLEYYLKDPDYTICLPVPPSVNELFGQRGGQQKFKTQAYKKWLKACPALEDKAYQEVVLQYCYYWKTPHVRDTENYMKAVSDYISPQKKKAFRLIKDDNWRVIKDHRITPMGVDQSYPRVEIYIWDLNSLDKNT